MIKKLILATSLLLFVTSNHTTAYKTQPLSDAERVWYCERSPDCKLLSTVGYFESRNQKSDAAVVGPMFVVLNRRDHPKMWGSSLHSVVYAPFQFSYVHDGSLKRGIKEVGAYKRMLVLAHKVYSGDVKDPTNGALWYHTHQVSPGWSKKLKHVVTLGDHKFYKRVKNES